MKLCQLIALIGGKKKQVTEECSKIYQMFDKHGLFQGLSRRYLKLNEDGDSLPDENQHRQLSVNECLKTLRRRWTELWDLVLSQDLTNMKTKADVTIGGEVLLKGVPVTHLLFLEKQLVDLRTALTAAPTLDPQEVWDWDPNTEGYVSGKTFTNRTKKVPKVLTLAEATKEHPAQAQVYNDDVVIGKWEQVKFSGAIPLEDKSAMLERLSALIDAVVSAREEANTNPTENGVEGEKIFDYILGKS